MPTAILSVYDKTGIVEFAQEVASSAGAAGFGRNGQPAAPKWDRRYRGGGLHPLAGAPGRKGQDFAPGHPRRIAGTAHGGRSRQLLDLGGIH